MSRSSQMKRSAEERRRPSISPEKLLEWLSSVSGLPVDSISQCQNGAIFCIVTALGCPELCDELQKVNFEALTESQCLENYLVLQNLASAAQIGGLNYSAGNRSWMKLAKSKDDAFRYLKLLHRTLHHLEPAKEIEDEATCPPAPRFSSRGSRSSQLFLGTAVSGAIYSPAEFGYRMSSGTLEEELKRQPSFASEAGTLALLSSLSPLASQRTRSEGLESKNSLYNGSDSGESSPRALDSADSSASSVEAFMFPSDLEESNDLLRRTLSSQEGRKAVRPRYQKHALEIYSDPPHSPVSQLERGLVFAPETSESQGPVKRPARRPSSRGTDILGMIKDLDEMIATLDDFSAPAGESDLRCDAVDSPHGTHASFSAFLTLQDIRD